jgi:hypothetical protein
LRSNLLAALDVDVRHDNLGTLFAKPTGNGSTKA